MKTIKKLTASVLAVASAAAMTATMAPAFAYEDTAAAQAAFINSFDEGIDQKVAKFLFDNGYTLTEAQDAMDIYVNGLAMMETSANASNARAVSNNYYYNSSAIAPTEHFALVIAATPAYTATKVTIDVIASSGLVTSSENYFMYSSYSSYVNSVDHEYAEANNQWDHCAVLRGITAKSDPVACAALRYPITPGNSIATESALRQCLTFDVSTISNYEFALETYARGDVNHDGYVNQTDSTLLLQFLVESETLDITYADGSNHFSYVTNVMAADYNLDGIVNLADATQLNSYLNS